MRTIFTRLLVSAVLLYTPLEASSTLEKTLSAMAGTEAAFTHKFLAKGFKKEQMERGTVVFGAAPNMRWSYTHPEKKEFVFDGSTSWFYTPSERQVVISTLSDDERRALPFLLLNDPAATRQNFTVTEQRGAGSTTMTLTAKRRDDAIRRISITRGNRDSFIRRLEYVDRGGNRTTFEFTGHRRRPAAAGVFQFTPPAGVDVVRN